MLSILNNVDFHLVKAATDWTANAPWHIFVVYLAAEVLIYAYPIVLLFLWSNRKIQGHMHGGQKAVVLAIFSVVLALAVKSLVSFLYTRPRPFITHPDLLYMHLRVDPASFPSGHTLVVFAIASSLLWSGFRKIGWLLLIGAVLVALGRVFAGVHYPSDVLGGALIGLASAWFWHREGNSLKQYLPNH